jgi:hypothetical protein
MKQRRPDDWTAEEKVEAILSYEKLSEEQRGVFLREKGLHEAHVIRWKAELIAAMKQRPFAGGKKNPQQKRISALEKELQRKESALAEAAALLVPKKSRLDLGGGKGREISLEDRGIAGQLIREAVGAGARLWKACEVLEITVRTYQRWG